MNRHRRLALVVASVLIASPAAAQRTDAPAGSARAVAQRALAALAARDAANFAREAHPQDLAVFRGRMLPGIREAMNGQQKPQVLATFAPAKTYAEIEKLPAERLFVMYLQSAMNRVAKPDQLKISNVIIGEVTEGDTVSHVVYRQRVVLGKNPPASNVTLISLRRTPGGWKLTLDATLMGGTPAQQAQ
ncbi:MAG: hypothetical protein H0U85_01505 [Gemmatimonadales bacterium]|nr:hypothetical protein [Gemmatimonadales bacterium]